MPMRRAHAASFASKPAVFTAAATTTFALASA
jgi:hypothetical protein